MNMENAVDEDITSSVADLTPEFIASLEKQLDEKLRIRKAEIEQLTASNAELKRSMKIKCKKIREKKNKIANCKKSIQAKEETLECLTESLEHMNDYAKRRQNDVEQYEQETVEFDLDQRKRLRDLEIKWQSLKAKYDKSSLAAVEAKEQGIALRKDKIELMWKEAKLKEIKAIVDKQSEILITRRNNKIVKSAELYQEAEFKIEQLRQVLCKEKMLEEESRRQETKIAELKNNQTILSSVSRQSKAGSLGRTRLSQRHRYVTPEFNLPSLVDHARTQPMPLLHLAKDFDTMSITSSDIDALSDTIKPAETREAIESGGAKLSGEENPNVTDEHRTDDPNPEDEALGKFGTGYPTEKDSDLQEPKDANAPEYENGDKMTAEPNAREVEAVDFNPPCPKESVVKKSRQNFMVSPSPKRNLQFGEPEIKRPRITRVEKINLNVSQHKLTDPKTPKDASDSLAAYFTASQSGGPSIDSNWKPDGLSRFSSYAELQKDPDLMSNFGSQTSMLTEDMMKGYHTSFSPELGEREKLRTLGGDNHGEYSTPQNSGMISQVAEPQRGAAGFLNLAAAPNRRAENNKDHMFFESLF